MVSWRSEGMAAVVAAAATCCYPWWLEGVGSSCSQL